MPVPSYINGPQTRYSRRQQHQTAVHSSLSWITPKYAMSALTRHRLMLSITALVLIPLTLAANTVTLLDPIATQQQQAIMHTDISTLIHQTNRVKEDNNARLHSLTRYFNNRPYLYSGAQGEGQACDSTHLAHCPHLQQDPLVRTDGFNCTTYASVLPAYSTNQLSPF